MHLISGVNSRVTAEQEDVPITCFDWSQRVCWTFRGSITVGCQFSKTRTCLTHLSDRSMLIYDTTKLTMGLCSCMTLLDLQYCTAPLALLSSTICACWHHSAAATPQSPLCHWLGHPSWPGPRSLPVALTDGKGNLREWKRKTQTNKPILSVPSAPSQKTPKPCPLPKHAQFWLTGSCPQCFVCYFFSFSVCKWLVTADTCM